VALQSLQLITNCHRVGLTTLGHEFAAIENFLLIALSSLFLNKKTANKRRWPIATVASSAWLVRTGHGRDVCGSDIINIIFTVFFAAHKEVAVRCVDTGASERLTHHVALFRWLSKLVKLG
jgi:hypothetical protein